MGKLLFLFLSILFLSSCKKDKLKAPAASFVVVNTISLTTTASQGSNSTKITDIWYYVDDNFKGVFSVGSVMPIVSSGNVKLTFFAGIKNNGISATRLPYEFYAGYTVNQTLIPGQTYTINPVFQYVSNSVFPAQASDDFDGSGFKYKSVGDSSYTLISDPNKVFGGIGKSVFMSMSNAKPTAKIITTTPLNLPLGGTTIYLEFNYKSNQAFEVGVVGGSFDKRVALGVNASSEWNKIYVQLTSAVSTQPTYNFYDIFISATKKVDVPEIYIDNIKIVTR